MTKVYNLKYLTSVRKQLRHNCTTAELILWQEIRGKNISGYKFRRQYSVNNYIIDFYCPKLKLAIEVDGSIHNIKEIKELDKIRQNMIEQFGITFLRFRNPEIFNHLENVIKEIKLKIDELL